MEMIGFLILFPLVVAGLLMVVRQNKARNIIICVGSAVIAAASIALVAANLGTPGLFFYFDSDAVSLLSFILDCVIGVVIICYGVKYRNWLSVVLALVMIISSVVLEVVFLHDAVCTRGLYLDSLSLIMTLIIGIIGTGICVYAIGYMEDHYDHNKDQKDRRHTFFALMFVFLSAMYGVIFFNNLTWLLTAWETTTLCSFLLIGFTKTKESIINSFRQIVMNMIGGIGFIAALYYLVIQFNCIDFMEFIVTGTLAPGLVVFPLVCLSLAGLTKAAQMPFHTWLLGAMVAPTPTSALLHSSTMVKAGVFVLIKCAPIYAVSFIPSMMIILIGGLTFLFASCIAISQTNAKRVLAYSTIANLGLITCCAGVGTPEAVWAAIFLVIFHAVAKSLLFLCVGTAEHHISSRDIEDMDSLFERMPKLARYMMLGIMIMFVAPFGMLIAKWATLVSFVDTSQFVLLLILAFGSAATFMFWAKWLGKLAGIAGEPENVEKTVWNTEWFVLVLMAVLAVACCVLIPVISYFMVEPYIASVNGISIQPISDDNLWIAAIMVIAMVLILFTGLHQSKKSKKVGIYLSGVSVDNENRMFKNSLSEPMEATARNWYLDNWFGERTLAPIGTIACYILLGIGFLGAIVSITGFGILL